MKSHFIAIGIALALVAVAALAIVGIGPKIVGSHDGSTYLTISKGGLGSFQLRDDDLNLNADWDGKIVFADDGRSIEKIDGELTIKEKAGKSKTSGVKRMAVFEGNGSLDRAELTIDGAVQPAGPETDAALADLLQLYVRESGVNADARVKSLAATGGVARVLEEVRAIKTERGKARYLSAAAEELEFAESDLTEFFALIAEIGGDNPKADVLESIIEYQPRDAVRMSGVRDVALTIGSDFEKRSIVKAFEDGALTEEALETIDAIISEIGSDHEIRLALEDVFDNDALTADMAARLLAAGLVRCESDHERRLMMEATIESVDEIGGALAQALISGLAEIDSDHEKRLAVEEIAAGLDDETADLADWEALAAATTSFGSDHEQRLAIEAIAEEVDFDEARFDGVAQTLREVAESIGSDQERRLALEALQ